jgi:hypothetical protein
MFCLAHPRSFWCPFGQLPTVQKPTSHTQAFFRLAALFCNIPVDIDEMLQMIIQFLLVAGYLIKCLLTDAMQLLYQHRWLLSNAALLGSMIFALVYRRELKATLAPQIEQNICEIKEIIGAANAPPQRPESVRLKPHRGHVSSQLCSEDVDPFDEEFSEDMSSADRSNDSGEWESHTQTTHESSEISAENALKRSVAEPRVLVGWKIAVDGREGISLILSVRKKRFGATKFVVQHHDGRIEKLRLRRGDTKGDVGFTLLEKAV